MGYNLTRYEQEIIITFNAEEGEADIYTADPVYIRKLDKLVEQNPEQFKLIKQEMLEGKVISKRYTFPKRFITIRSKDVKLNLTEEQREEQSERAKKSFKIDSTLSQQ